MFDEVKVFLVTILLVVVIFICVMLFSSAMAPREEVTTEEIPNRYYALTAVICDLESVNDFVYCEDFNGNLWVFKGIEDWQEGDLASLLMDNNNTIDITDDIILSAHYGGYLKSWK